MRWVLVATLGASVALWSAAARAQCTKDIDCKADRVCNAGVCQAAQQPALPVEPALVPTPIAYRRRSTAWMVSGIVLTSLGTASLFTGLGLTIAQVSCRGEPDELERCRAFDSAALATLLAGFGAASVGVPLIVYGGKKLPREPAGATVAPWLMADAAGLQLRVRM